MALEDPSFLAAKFVGFFVVVGFVVFFQISSEKVPYNTTEYHILSVLPCAVVLSS